MEITFLGLSSFLINASGIKREKVQVLINPAFEGFKKRPTSLKPDILLSGQEKMPTEIKGKPFLIEGPGEYETKGIFIQGIKEKEALIYLIEAEEVRLCHLNSFSQQELRPEFLEKLGNIDILLVPVGGALGPEGAANIISQIEPKIVIPMEFKTANVKSKLGKLEDFLKVVGVEKPETFDKLKISQKKLPEEIKVFVLK